MVETWKFIPIVGAAAALAARVMWLWPGLPPPRHWSLRARTLVWIAFAAVTAFFSVAILILWSLREEAAA
jgi:ABC-type transport system involved in cytochrome c biogenesis permease subunit